MKKQRGTVLFSNITKPPVFNGASTGKFELSIILDDMQRADSEEAGLQVSVKEYNGSEQCSAKFKTKFSLNTTNVVDNKKKPYVDNDGNIKEIPRSSEVVVFYTQRPYTMAGKSGITNDLKAIMVLKETAGIDFDEYVDDIENQEVDDDVEF